MSAKRIYVLCSSAILTLTTAAAQNIDQVYLKDGSVYEGYISEQVPGKSISVTTEKATVFVDSDDITSISYANKEVAQLAEPFRLWVKENQPRSRSIEVATLVIKNNRQLQDVVVLERGVRMKVLSFTKELNVFGWNDLLKTTRTPYVENAKMGIRDVVTMKDGARYEGQIIEQMLCAAQIKIRTLEGDIYSVDTKDLLSIRSEKINDDAALWKQTPLLDKVELKSGEAFEGFIISRISGVDITILVHDTGIEKTIPLERIAKYCRTPNPSYGNAASVHETETETSQLETSNIEEENAKAADNERSGLESSAINEDPFMDEGAGSDVLIDGVPVSRLEVINYDDKFYLVKDPITIRVFVGDEVHIEMPAVAHSSVQVVRMSERDISMTSSYPIKSGTYPTYSDKEILEAADTSWATFKLEDVDENKRTLITLVISKPGNYVIFPFDDTVGCVALEAVEKN